MEPENVKEVKVVEAQIVPVTPHKSKGRFLPLGAALFALFAVLIAALWNTAALNLEYENRFNTMHEQAYNGYGGAVNHIEQNLSQMRGMQDPAMSAELAAQTYRHSVMANAWLASMPYSENERAETGNFFNRIGDWSLGYNRALLDGSGADTHHGQIEELYTQITHYKSQNTTGHPNVRGRHF